MALSRQSERRRHWRGSTNATSDVVEGSEVSSIPVAQLGCSNNKTLPEDFYYSDSRHSQGFKVSRRFWSSGKSMKVSCVRGPVAAAGSNGDLCW